MTSQMLDVSLHERRRDRRMQDPQYRAAYEQAARELAQTDAVIRQLDSLRALIAALADALGAELRVVPRTTEARRAVREHGRVRRVADTG